MASTPPLKILAGTALTEQQKKDLLHRLARVEGQLRGVQKLVAKAAEPEDCEAIAQQMSAARKALDRAFVTLMTSAIVTQAEGEGGEENRQHSLQRLVRLLDKFA